MEAGDSGKCSNVKMATIVSCGSAKATRDLLRARGLLSLFPMGKSLSPAVELLKPALAILSALI